MSESEPEPSESPSSAPSRGPARTPGTRTPRRVQCQWATAVDEDEGDGDHHCVDQAGLNASNFLLPLISHSQFSFFTDCCLSIAHQCPRTSQRHHRSNSVWPLLTLTGSVPAQQFRQPQSSTPFSAESSVPASLRRPSSGIDLLGEPFIGPHERAGLPVSRSEHEKEDALSDSELRAAHVVRAHSRNPFRLPKRLYRRRRPRATKERRDSEGIDREEVIDVPSPMTRMQGGGILSALLALYDHDRDSHILLLCCRIIICCPHPSRK